MRQSTLIHHLSDNLASLPFLLPEGLLAITLMVILVLGGIFPQAHQHNRLRLVALIGLALVGSSKYWLGAQSSGQMLFLYNQLLVITPLSTFFSLFLLGITAILLLVLPPPTQPAATPTHVALLLGGLLGSFLLMMASHWLSIYLGLTLLSLSTAILIGSQPTPLSAASSLKYFLYSTATIAAMLWGMSYFYGFTGTLHLYDPASLLRLQALSRPMISTIILLCLSNIFFVLAAVPYHFWLPDVYQGTRPFIVAYVATVPKLAALVTLWQLFRQYLPQLASLPPTYGQQALAALALVTLIVGHTGALLQNNLQRLLAYGAIAQVGMLLAGIATLPSSAVGLLYYSILDGVASLAAWLGLERLQQLTGSLRLQNCAGVGRQFPWLGISMTVVMMALVGLPPTVGFTGKLLLLTGLWSHAQATGNPLYASLVVASLAGTVFSLYYYLKLPYVLFAKASAKHFIESPTGRTTSVIMGLLAVLLLVAFWAGSSLLPTSIVG